MLFSSARKTIDALELTLASQLGLIQALDRSMAIIEFDPSGQVLHANANFEKTMGYRAEQIIGQPHRMFC
ncbi:PAS domain S-box protein [Pseudomonas abieticivorans]|uniref:PAS domain S-box protein n=1 Tax=Pseudomonas abieticivorans TaxID=2931382 RepID=UPI003F690941